MGCTGHDIHFLREFRILNHFAFLFRIFIYGSGMKRRCWAMS